MKAVLPIILIALGLVILALGAVAKHRNINRKTEYVLFSTMDDKHLPKRIFPFANKRDYQRVRIGSARSSYVVTIDFLQNIAITLGFILLSSGMLLLGGPRIGYLVVLAVIFALITVLMWLFTDWKVDSGCTTNTIHL